MYAIVWNQVRKRGVYLRFSLSSPTFHNSFFMSIESLLFLLFLFFCYSISLLFYLSPYYSWFFYHWINPILRSLPLSSFSEVSFLLLTIFSLFSLITSRCYSSPWWQGPRTCEQNATGNRLAWKIPWTEIIFSRAVVLFRYFSSDFWVAMGTITPMIFLFFPNTTTYRDQQH